MHLRHAAAAAAVLFSLTLFLLPSTTNALNITNILAKYPEFSTFNHYLTATQLAPEINSRETITVCVVDNGGMGGLLSKHLTLGEIKNVLSLHILLDYFDAKKLHLLPKGTAFAATIFQSTGSASGTSGYVQISDLKGGAVGFSQVGSDGAANATFVKSVEAVPYNFSIIQISNILPSPAAEAPATTPTQVNLTSVMSAHGCKVFADTLLANAAALTTFVNNVESGLIVFCPGDDAMKRFMPKYKNLTADGKQSLLEYHGMPVYETLSDLRSNNGLANTLATDGAMQFSFTVQNDGTTVTIKTPIVTAKIISTLREKDPLAIFQLDKVLIPGELFKSSLPPSPAPAPAPQTNAKAPKSSGKHKSPPAPVDSPADAPAGSAADETSNGSPAGLIGARFGALIFSLWFAFIQLTLEF